MILRVLPELSHVEKIRETGGENESAEGLPFYVTLDGRVGVILSLPPVDIESREAGELFKEFGRFLSKLKPGINAKLIARAAVAGNYPFKNSRSAEIASLGWVRHKLFVVLESGPRTSPLRRGLQAIFSRASSFQGEADYLYKAAPFEALRRLHARPVLKESEIREFFPNPMAQVTPSKTGLELPSARVAVLRIWRQSQQFLDEETLARLREDLVPPYEIVVNLRRVSDVRSQYLLQRRRGQKAASTDTLAARGLAQTEEALEATLIGGDGLLEMEWLLVLKRSSETQLREDIATCSRALSRLGDVLEEVPGAWPSWLASLPGTDPHHTFLERDSLAPLYCPVLIRGEEVEQRDPPRRALPLHRRDGSLYHFDLFRAGYDGANCVINGRRGKGKSVLANLISSGLLLDPDVRLIKVDVGSSYVKECELNQGRHVQFNLSEPSGLNPFRLIREVGHAEDAAAVLAAFLGTLILESKETVLSKEIHGLVERAVLAYAEKQDASPSLDGFLSSAPSLPRRALLERFTRGGVFANVLRERPESDGLLSNRYVYFNFERLTHAADEDFAQAVMAAVIASVNLEVIKAGDARRGDRSRVVFFADETPFFIQRNGRFFKLTTANFRKFGHGTVLIAQTTQDFILPKEGGGSDAGILVNSPIRFFYQVDDEPKAFAERFGLSVRQVEEVQHLERGEKFREVFLQDELGGRVLRVGVTPEEYWRVTSSRADNEKLEALRRAVPGLTLKEAIRCLAV
jgi:hypothetical protein